MKNKLKLWATFCTAILVFFTSCIHSGGEKSSNSIPKEYWGTWIRMDNGEEYTINDKTVTVLGVSTEGIGEITQESENVLKYGSAPTAPRLFRKGGSNRSFTAKLAGFDDNIYGNIDGRAAGMGGQSISGRKAKRQNVDNNSDNETVVSDEDGKLTFTGAVADETQEITVETGKGTKVQIEVIPHYDGESVGTIPLVEKGYSFKTTYTMNGDLNGYFYGNNYAIKDGSSGYPLMISLKNIGDEDCSTAMYVLSTDDPNLQIHGETSGIFSTIEKGAQKRIPLSVNYGALEEEYVDSVINIAITDTKYRRTWNDSVTLRFYRRPIYIGINTYSLDRSYAAKLNGFVICPDGRSQYFSMWHKTSADIVVPWAKGNHKYMLVFSGAKADQEMYYSFSCGTTYFANSTMLDLQSYLEGLTVTERFELVSSYESGNGNNKWENAVDIENCYDITKSFLNKGDLDYFIISPEILLSKNALQPIIYTQPKSYTSVSGKRINLTVNAETTDNGKLSYQWYKSSSEKSEGKIIDGATQYYYSVPTNEQGISYYYCVITNTIHDNGDGGKKSASIKSNVVYVDIDDSTPVFDINFSEHNDIDLTVDNNVFTTSAGFENYDWFVNGEKKSSGKDNTFSYEIDDVRVYDVMVVVTASDGKFYSGNVQVKKIIEKPEDSYPEASGIVNVSEVIDISITKNGNILSATSGYAGYEWYVDRVKQSETSSAFTFDSVLKGFYRIMVIAKDSNGKIYSANILIEIN